MSEDQKDPAVGRNYLSSHRQGIRLFQGGMDDLDDYSNESSVTEIDVEPAEETNNSMIFKLSNR